MMPHALVEAAGALGVELSGTVGEAAALLVAGTLGPRTRFGYGRELGDVARWCDAHGLRLLELSPLDVAALVVARRSAGQDPRNLMAALSFAYRNKPGGPEPIADLARRVDKVWRAKNRQHRPPTRRAPVLPLPCWLQMHAAVGSDGYLDKAHPLNEERLARDRLIISLGLSAGMRSGEFSRLSASRSRFDEAGRLVLPLLAGSGDATTKTGLTEISVPLGVPPFDVLPLADDFERLRRFRLSRAGGEDHLVSPAWQSAIRGGLAVGTVTAVLRKAARHAGIARGERVAGHSLRRSMIHIAAAAGWTLEQIAAVTGHASSSVIERAYLEGYGGMWTRSDEGRQLLVCDPDGWEDSPVNWSPGLGRGPSSSRRWWEGRDLQADRAEAAALARSTPRVGFQTASEVALIGRKWEAFCQRCGADPAKPGEALLEMFAIDMCTGITSSRHTSIRFLADWFAALPSTPLADIPVIRQWAINASNVGGRIAAENRRQANVVRKRRKIVPVSDEAMEKLFAQPIVNRIDALRLRGLILGQCRPEFDMTEIQRTEFRFGRDARIADGRAELFAPLPDGSPKRPADCPPAAIVERVGGDPAWCGYEAVRQMIAHYPTFSFKLGHCPDPLISYCTPLIRWLQARAAVAVLYATGLRPTDLDGFRWPDLRVGDDGAIMWRLPYSKGNVLGDRVQVLRLEPSDSPWCPVTALTRLAASIHRACDAGWGENPSFADSDGVVRRVFPHRPGNRAYREIIEPAGVEVRPQDFRYRMAAKLWAETRDIQMVRGTLFHRSETVSMGYVKRGLPAGTRAAIDPLSRVYHNTGR